MGVEKEMKMAESLQKLNHVIHRSALSSSFVSLFYAEIESNGNIFYVNAGHPPPVLVINSNVSQLNSTGVILGAASEISLHRGSISIEPGAVLVMYSDGLLERFNDDEEDFGLARLKKLIVQNQDSCAQKILEIIYKTVYAFGKETKWQDDVTVVVIKRLSS
jgi:phosphoserine phosphatase RsbU/P